MKTKTQSEKCVTGTTKCTLNSVKNKGEILTDDSILCSSAVEPTTVNRLVAGSNPAGGVDKNQNLSYTISCVKEVQGDSISLLAGLV